MSTVLTIDLPEDFKETLGKAAREDGVSEKVFAARALQDYLLLRRFRSLRERIMAKSEQSYSDQEIFDIVS